MWRECPFAADDIMELDRKQRPICVYERLEYDALVAQYVPSGEEESEIPNFDRHTDWKKSQKFSAKPHLDLVHTVALLQVMMSRAAA